jgi:dTDP-glucose 4,6-dehydratase
MSTKVVYVTGCLGFIGFHVAKHCLDKGWYVRGIDSGTYAANWNLLEELRKSPKFVFEHKDINELDILYECDYIINTAAETHVDNSIADSDVFVRSNIDGVHHLLKLIKNNFKFKMPTLLHFSTDEVYGDIVDGAHTEKDLLKPSNPYSATKAAADMLVTAFARTYNIPYVIVRPTNNYGIGQYTEKFIPHTVKYISLGKPAPLHDAGTPRRTWLNAGDTARAVITIIEAGVVNEIYNIAGNYEEQNIVVAKKIIDLMRPVYGMTEAYEDYLDLSVTRQGQDVRYSVDDSKLKSLGWSPLADFDNELKLVVQYYMKNFIW